MSKTALILILGCLAVGLIFGFTQFQKQSGGEKPKQTFQSLPASVPVPVTRPQIETPVPHRGGGLTVSFPDSSPPQINHVDMNTQH